MALRNEVVAGLANSAFASLTSFIVGVYAARTFSPELLGAFAIFMSGFLFAAMIPSQSYLVPLEAWAVSLDLQERGGVIFGSLRAALPFLAIPALLPLAFSYLSVVLNTGDSSDGLRLLATSYCAAIVSPVQDHLRSMFFVCRKPWNAVSCSAVLLLTTVAALAFFDHIETAETLRPFGAIAVANIVSIGLGLFQFQRIKARPNRTVPAVPQLLTSGSWLFAANCVTAGSTLLGFSIVGSLGGMTQLGFLEAARTVSQPVVVFAVGFSTALSPRTMEAVAQNNLAAQLRLIRLASGLCFLVGFLYLLGAGLPHSLNPMSALVPKAYSVPGLVGLMVLGSSLRGALRPLIAVLIAQKKTRKMARIALVGGVLLLSFCCNAGWLGGYSYAIGLPGARPLSKFKVPKSGSTAPATVIS